MIDFPFLTLLLLLPFVGILVIAFIKGNSEQVQKNVRAVALWSSLGALLVSLVVWGEFDSTKSAYQFVHHIPAIGGMGVNYIVGIDGVSLLMVMLTSFLVPAVIFAGWDRIQHRAKEYYLALLAMEIFVLGAFVSLNALMFYVFFEAVLIPMFLLIGIWGGENRVYATYKFFVYTFLGSILMLVAFLYIGFSVGSFNLMEWHSSFELGLVRDVVIALWWGLFIGFAIKIPMVPVHTWLPLAHVEAPATASMLLAGILLKMGGYAMIRFHLLLFPRLCEELFYIVATLSVLAIVYASLLAWMQTDIKKLVAYSSVAHMGYVTLGIYSQSKIGVNGAVLQMVSHGVISAGLFFMVDVLYRQAGSREISMYGGVASSAPKLSVLSFVLVLGLIAVPLTSGFVGEIMVTTAVFKLSPLSALFMVFGVVLAPIYGLTLYKKVFFGPAGEKTGVLKESSTLELLILGMFVVIVGWIGIYPKPLIGVLDQTVTHLMTGGVQ